MPNVGRKAPDKEHTQSVCFYKEKWTESEAKKWCKDNDYYTDGLDETDTLYRFRQYDPDDSKFRYRNKEIEKDSIFLVIGYLKEKKNMDPKRELRYISFDQFELREAEGQTPILVGYASVFNQETVIWGIWREKVAPGAFKNTIQKHDIRALWNHNTDLILGRNRSKTLTLLEDDHGLRVEITPPDTQAGKDAVTSIKRGDVSQMSIMFEAIKQEWYFPEDDREMPLRTITEAKLYEVSPVTFPAFEMTEISARSELSRFDENIGPLEEAMRLYILAQRGMPLTTEQRNKISAAVEIYQAIIVQANPAGQEPEGEPEINPAVRAQLENRRRALDLIEKL